MFGSKQHLWGLRYAAPDRRARVEKGKKPDESARGYCDVLAAWHPGIRLRPQRALVVTGDTRFFGRVFRRRVGLTPTQYRKHFRRLRQALQAPEH